MKSQSAIFTIAIMKLLLALCTAATFCFIFTPAGECMDIVGGDEVIPHSRPFMAHLNVECGGALIKPDWVLTAAHCFTGRLAQVTLGAHSLSSYEEEKQTFQIKKKVKHPRYNNKTTDNDIMLLQLEGEAKLNKFVSVLQLPTSGEEVKAGTGCSVAGWGSMKFNGQYADKLREVNITVIDRELCNSNDYYRKRITKNMMCAGDKNGGKDACQGDSGGPLLCNGVYRGIVSFGAECGLPKKPGVYTRLTEEYLVWIKNETTF